MKVTHKGLEYEISKIEVNRLIEKNLHDDLEFSCNETSLGFKRKSGMYKELAKVNMAMAAHGEKKTYHISTLLSNAIANHITYKIYKRSYLQLLKTQ